MTQLWEQRISFNKLLGLKVLSLDPADVRIRLDMRPELIGHYSYGRLHGGVTSASLDALGGMALMVAMGEKHCSESAEQVMHRFGRMGTIDLRVDFLRQGIGHHSSGMPRSRGWAGASARRRCACSTTRARSSPPRRRPSWRPEAALASAQAGRVTTGR